MRAKMLAVSAFCVVCVSGTTAHAGRERLLLRSFEWFEMIGRSSRAAEIMAMLKIEVRTLARQMNEYRNTHTAVMRKPDLKQPDELWGRQLGVHQSDFDALKALDGEAAAKQAATRASQDATVSNPANKAGKLGTLLDGTIAGGGTYCAVTRCSEPARGGSNDGPPGIKH
jgi:hypothetical protein